MSLSSDSGATETYRNDKRTTLGQCRPYSHCGECEKPDCRCPNMVLPERFCACGQPLTQSDEWRASEDGMHVCRYCRPAAAYIRDLLAEVGDGKVPVALADLWSANPWRPELTQVIITHLEALGVSLKPEKDALAN